MTSSRDDTNIVHQIINERLKFVQLIYDIIVQIWVVFSDFKLWIAVARQNFKWLKI